MHLQPPAVKVSMKCVPQSWIHNYKGTENNWKFLNWNKWYIFHICIYSITNNNFKKTHRHIFVMMIIKSSCMLHLTSEIFSTVNHWLRILNSSKRCLSMHSKGTIPLKRIFCLYLKVNRAFFFFILFLENIYLLSIWTPEKANSNVQQISLIRGTRPE